MQVVRWPSFMRLRDRYRVQLSALAASQRILVANVTMLLNSESGVDRHVIYFVDNKLKTLTLWRRALTSGSLHWYNSSPNWATTLQKQSLVSRCRGDDR